VGTVVGALVRVEVGVGVGSCVGRAVGSDVVGAGVGTVVGTVVRVGVGGCVGRAVGSNVVGAGVGVRLGTGVGAGVGAVVGAWQAGSPTCSAESSSVNDAMPFFVALMSYSILPVPQDGEVHTLSEKDDLPNSSQLPPDFSLYSNVTVSPTKPHTLK